MNRHITHQNFIYYLFLLALFAFLYLIRDYLMDLFFAALVAGMSYGFYNRLSAKFKGNKSMSAVVIILIFLLCIVIPTIFFISLIANQAISITGQITPIIDNIGNGNTSVSNSFIEKFPALEKLKPYEADIQKAIAKGIGEIGNLLMSGLSSFTQSTFSFILHLFIMLYALYSFLLHGTKLIAVLGEYLPLTKKDFDELSSKTISVTRATLKGALLIGIIQGALVGIGFWATGLPNPLFWGSIAVVTSLIPSLGTGLVWVPGMIYLFATDQTAYGIGLLVWGVLVVGTIDNILRPKLVGKDIAMPDLMVLITTLGGIGLFGLAGFVIGPIIGGLLMTIAQMYKST